MPNKDQGFTLVELMVTLALLAVIANIAVPALEGLITRNRQQALMEQVASALNNARAEAILQRRAIEVCGSHDGKKCSADWSSGWLVRTSDGRILHRVQLPPHDALRWSGFQQSIKFDNNGSSPFSNGRFYQCHKQKVTWQLILSRQGRLRPGTTAEHIEKASLCSS